MRSSPFVNADDSVLMALFFLIQAACHCMAELLGKLDPEVCGWSRLCLVFHFVFEEASHGCSFRCVGVAH